MRRSGNGRKMRKEKQDYSHFLYHNGYCFSKSEMGAEKLEYVLCHHLRQPSLCNLPTHGLSPQYLLMRDLLLPLHMLLRNADQLHLHKLEIARERRKNNYKQNLLGTYSTLHPVMCLSNLTLIVAGLVGIPQVIKWYFSWSGQLVCRVLDIYFIMRERQGFQLRDYEDSLPKGLIQSKSLNRLRKSLDNAQNMRLDLFRLRKSVSNTSLECHLHRAIKANPIHSVLPRYQMPM